MKVIASQDIGGLGAERGAAAVIEWKLAWSLLRGLPWVVVLGVLLLGPNRSRRAWMVLVPFISVLAVLGVIRRLLGYSTQSGMDPLMDIGGMLSGTLAVIWLQSYVFGQFRAWRSVLTTLLLVVGMGIVGAVALNGWGFGGGRTAIETLVIYLLVSLIALGALTVSGRRWRKHPRGCWGYGIRFLLWGVASGMALSLVFFLILVALGEGPSSWWGFVPQLLLIGGILGAATAAVTLPFVVLAFTSAFWRARFEAVFPPVMPEPAYVEGGDDAVVDTGEEMEPTPAPSSSKEAEE